MQSPVSKLFTAILDKIKTDVPSIKFTTQDLGQLDFYDDKPPVTFPAAMVDVGEAIYEEYMNNMQIVTTMVTIRLAHTTYSDVSSLASSQVRALGLKYYELEHELGNALHNWQPPHAELGVLTRVSVITEKRDDNIRVRVLTFSTSMQYDANLIEPSVTPLQVTGTINP